MVRMKVSLYKSIENLVNENEKIKSTKEQDKSLLRTLMILAAKGDKIGDSFRPKYFIKENQKEIIEKIKTYYKDEPIKIKRRILSKLVQYLKMYEDIKDEDYKEYEKLSEELLKTPDKLLESKIEKQQKACKELLTKDINKNVKLYAYIISMNVNIKPRTLVKLTIEPSENYIDLISNELITEDLKSKKKQKLDPEIGLKILKIIIPGKTEDEYKKLLKKEEELKTELKKQRKEYLIEETRKPLTSEQLSKALSFQIKQLKTKN